MRAKTLGYCLLLLVFAAFPEHAFARGKVQIAAAADLKFAMDDIISAFRQMHPGTQIDVTYGSSGKFYTQIRQGAPFDLYFSADIDYPRKLAADGLTASPPQAYALGRIVLWSATLDASKLQLKDLAQPRFDRIAVANPEHAPYGKRAVEALHASGVWNQVKDKLVYGENIAQTAQFVHTGNARIGIIALSLALNPTFAKEGGYAPIPQTLYSPLQQGFAVLPRAAHNTLALDFAHFMGTSKVKAILKRYGFADPAAPARS